jgi:transposase
MPAERAPMRKIREVLRLKYACGLSERQIALTIGLSRSTIKAYLKRAESCGIAWPIPAEIEDATLERRLFPPIEVADADRPLPDWKEVQKELKRRAVTLQLLWEEYRAQHIDGYCHSHFCKLHREWLKTVSPTMRQTHAAGEKLFVDWAGDSVPVFDALMGEERRAHIFVGVLGASNYIYAEARWSEALPDWIGAHVNAFAAIRGVPGAVVCDNLKAGVTTTCRYEPGINRTYLDLATHYDTAILPTRPRKPRDKAKVEVGVLIVERYVLARLRKRRFFSLAELNLAIRGIVADLNARIMRTLGISRIELLETIERPALKALPSEPYQYAEWKKCRVAPDYHVEVDHHYYSVPSRLIRQEVEARITDTTIRDLPQGQPCRQPCAFTPAQPAYHHSTAHAERAPALCGVDTVPDNAPCRLDRPGHDRPRRGDHEGQATSRAGLPRLPRHPAPRTKLWLGPSGSGLPPRQRDRRHHLQLDRLDPKERARQGLRTRTGAGGPADPARQHPRHRLLPLTPSRE